MMMENIDVSVIIVNYNTRQLTQNCIDSILLHTKDISYEIILVDNASIDDSCDFFIKDNRIIFISSPTNLGFGKANNLGYEYSKGDYVFFLNSDTIIKNNAIKIFYDQMMVLPADIACLGCILKDTNSNFSGSYGNFPVWYDEFFNRHKKQLLQAKIKKFPFIVEYVSGADMFIRRSVIELHGLFDADFFLYFEETELQRRYFKNGYKSVIIDGPDICHLEGGSSNDTAWKAITFTQSFFVYMKKDLSKNKYYIFRSIMFFKRFICLWNKPWRWNEKKIYMKVLIS